MSGEKLERLILRIDSEEYRYPLGQVPCAIGRGAQNAIVLQSDRISRNHALVQKNEMGGYSVFDLGSKNGTFLNGRRLSAPAPLRDGDVVTIDSFELVFSELVQGAELEPAPQSPPEPTVRLMLVHEITVVVIDIRDFTGLTRDLGHARIAELIGAFNRETGACFENAQACAVKYIGDAVMAVWDHGRTQSVEAVLRSAFEAIAAISSFAGDLQARFDLPRPLLIGAGINAGPAILGNIGSSISSDYTALGDVVNKAFRLESSTRLLDTELAFGDEVCRILGDPLVAGVTRSHRLQLKGYSEPCSVYYMPVAKLPELLKLMPPVG
jgi:adenylate cyclase